jgi:LuxR family maltose regulon positive regulatory protein
MPKPSLHTLTWSEEHQHYKLYTHGHPRQYFRRRDEQSWQRWLAEQRSFAFQGQYGHLSVIKEIRPRGTGYWYAYNTLDRQIRKRYLGPTARVTLQLLEEAALALTTTGAPTSPSKHYPTQESSPAHQSQSSVPLPGTKHMPPRLPAALVKRARLLKSIDSVLDHALLLLSAPAGSGKTTLLSTWATSHRAKQSHSLAWLSLEELDNEPVRFWALVITALRNSDPRLSGIGELALAMLYAPQPQPLATVLTSLINELLGYASEIVLILDDYHVIEEQQIQDAMLFLLDHLPPNLHLILACRVDPAFPLARWRMHGEMIEIRATDVYFTQEEAGIFLQQGMGLALSQAEVGLLAERTEGWIAGLQLAALSLSSQQGTQQLPALVQRFSGGQRFILDYVQEEIIQQQPLPVQHFLLQISILSRMNAALCQALTGESASQELLEQLERSNLFVMPLDEQRQWYRLHTLFREVLLARLQATQPNLVPCLHQRAAHWHAAQDYIHEAISHAQSARDYSLAASVMERAARQLWLHGEAKTLSTWVLQLPDSIFQTRLDFALTAALHLLSSMQNMPEQSGAAARAQSEQIIARVEQLLPGQSLALSVEQRLRHRIGLLRELVKMSTAFRSGNIHQVRLCAQKMHILARDEFVAWQWLSLYGFFVSAQSLGDAVLLLPELLALKQQALQEQDRAIAMVVMCWIAASLFYAGRLHALHQECLQVQQLLEQAGSPVSVAAYPAFDLAFLYYEWNQLEEAESCLQTAIQHADHWQDMNLLVWGYSAFVKVLLAARKIEEAEQALQEAHNLIQQTGFTVYQPAVMAAQVSLWLAQGRLADAGAWADQYPCNLQAPEYIHVEAYLAQARVYLARQQYAQCLQLLTRLLSSVEGGERQWEMIHLLALQIVALYCSGQTEQACQVAARLLVMTEPEGYIRVYLDAGQPMRQVLQMLLAAFTASTAPPYPTASSEPQTSGPAIAASYVSLLQERFEQEEHKRALQLHLSPTTTATTTSQPPTQGIGSALAAIPYEALSPQELRVLRLLVAGYTYAEIARELVVSLNTIKTQVSSIYRKLGVSRRAEATALTQRLRLLP